MDGYRAYHKRVVMDAKERLKTMTPQELFNARCDATIRKRTRPRLTTLAGLNFEHSYDEDAAE